MVGRPWTSPNIWFGLYFNSQAITSFRITILFLPKTLAQGQIAVDKHRTMFDASLARDTKTAKAVLETPIRNGLDHALSAMTDSNT